MINGRQEEFRRNRKSMLLHAKRSACPDPPPSEYVRCNSASGAPPW